MKNNDPRSETFDALRAGLQVEDVDFKDTFTPELIDQENAHWQRVVDTLEERANGDRATRNQLRIRRRQVLNGECAQGGRWGLPHVVAGAAASVAVLLGAALWWDTIWSPPSPSTRTASIEWDSNWRGSSAARTVSVDSMNIESIEFTNNIDFYTWLEKQSDTVANSDGG